MNEETLWRRLPPEEDGRPEQGDTFVATSHSGFGFWLRPVTTASTDAAKPGEVLWRDQNHGVYSRGDRYVQVCAEVGNDIIETKWQRPVRVPEAQDNLSTFGLHWRERALKAEGAGVGAILEVIKQLIIGPVWDGDLASKQARDTLVLRGIAERDGNGMNRLKQQPHPDPDEEAFDKAFNELAPATGVCVLRGSESAYSKKLWDAALAYARDQVSERTKL